MEGLRFMKQIRRFWGLVGFTVSGFQRLQGINAGLEHARYDHFAHASTSATAAAAATMLPKQQ